MVGERPAALRDAGRAVLAARLPAAGGADLRVQYADPAAQLAPAQEMTHLGS